MGSPTSRQLYVLLLFPQDLLCASEGHTLGRIADLGEPKSSRGDHGVSVVPIFQMEKTEATQWGGTNCKSQEESAGPSCSWGKVLSLPIPEVRRRNRGHGRGLATLDLLQVQKGPENFHFIEAFSYVESMKKYPHRIGEVMWCFRCLTDQTHA